MNSVQILELKKEGKHKMSTEEFVRGNEIKVTSMNEIGIENLSKAVNSTYVNVEGYETQTQDHAIEYEREEYFNHILKIAELFLTPLQWKIIQMK